MGDSKSVAKAAEAAHHNNFDFLRFVAASLVLVSHSYPLLGRSDEPFGAFLGYESGGGIAVAIFFAISGYLVTGSFLRSRSIGDYIKKRSLRLLPALCLVVVLSALVLGPILSTLSVRDYVLHPQTRDYLRNCLLYIGYHLPGVFAENPYPHAVNGSLWTLPVEGVMYLLVLVFGWRKSLNPLALAAAIAGLGVFQFLLIDYLGLSNAVWGNLFLVPASVKLGLFFLSGAFLYVMRERIAMRNPIAWAMLAALLGTVHTPIGPFVFQCTLPYLTIWAAFANVQWINRFGRYGDFSYGIYLFAFPVQQSLVHMFGIMSVPVFAGLAFAVTLFLAAASWHCVEKPALAWKTRRFRLARSPLPVDVVEDGFGMSGGSGPKKQVNAARGRAA
jgi:peptidoglycan/LPS O-acetylase OafA/YrhL